MKDNIKNIRNYIQGKSGYSLSTILAFFIIQMIGKSKYKKYFTSKVTKLPYSNVVQIFFNKLGKRSLFDVKEYFTKNKIGGNTPPPLSSKNKLDRYLEIHRSKNLALYINIYMAFRFLPKKVRAYISKFKTRMKSPQYSFYNEETGKWEMGKAVKVLFLDIDKMSKLQERITNIIIGDSSDPTIFYDRKLLKERMDGGIRVLDPTNLKFFIKSSIYRNANTTMLVRSIRKYVSADVVDNIKTADIVVIGHKSYKSIDEKTKMIHNTMYDLELHQIDKKINEKNKSMKFTFLGYISSFIGDSPLKTAKTSSEKIKFAHEVYKKWFDEKTTLFMKTSNFFTNTIFEKMVSIKNFPFFYYMNVMRDKVKNMIIDLKSVPVNIDKVYVGSWLTTKIYNPVITDKKFYMSLPMSYKKSATKRGFVCIARTPSIEGFIKIPLPKIHFNNNNIISVNEEVATHLNSDCDGDYILLLNYFDIGDKDASDVLMKNIHTINDLHNINYEKCSKLYDKTFENTCRNPNPASAVGLGYDAVELAVELELAFKDYANIDEKYIELVYVLQERIIAKYFKVPGSANYKITDNSKDISRFVTKYSGTVIADRVSNKKSLFSLASDFDMPYVYNQDNPTFALISNFLKKKIKFNKANPNYEPGKFEVMLNNFNTMFIENYDNFKANYHNYHNQLQPVLDYVNKHMKEAFNNLYKDSILDTAVKQQFPINTSSYKKDAEYDLYKLDFVSHNNQMFSSKCRFGGEYFQIVRFRTNQIKDNNLIVKFENLTFKNKVSLMIHVITLTLTTNTEKSLPYGQKKSYWLSWIETAMKDLLSGYDIPILTEYSTYEKVVRFIELYAFALHTINHFVNNRFNPTTYKAKNKDFIPTFVRKEVIEEFISIYDKEVK